VEAGPPDRDRPLLLAQLCELDAGRVSVGVHARDIGRNARALDRPTAVR
jgi:hypothetical protein